MKYAELQVTTNFSFLRGASHPNEIIEEAIKLGYESIAITDRNTFAGVVRAHIAARDKKIQLIPGCRLDLADGPGLIALPTNVSAYSLLSSLLTLGNLRTEKGKCLLYKADVYQYAKDSKFIVIPPESLDELFEFEEQFVNAVKEYKKYLGSQLYIAASRTYQNDDAKRLFRISQLSKALKIPMVATNDVHYHSAERRELQDVITCVREKCAIQNAGFRLLSNAERYMKADEEMKRIFDKYPDAIRQTEIIAEACQFKLTDLKYQYPKEINNEGRTALEQLEYLTWKGAKEKFGNNLPEKIVGNIKHELSFIKEKNFPEYFLTVHDIVNYARGKEILCQGRGSAANSTVCYCLGITSVDPSKFDLLFERFISSARNEPPDIDVDFEHERREEVIQYIYQKYGRNRAGVVATVTQLHHKGAIRDVGKVMGLSVDTINRLSGLIWDFRDEGFDKKRITSQGINPDDAVIQKVLQLTSEYIGFPRQLGQHTGGFVITDGNLSDICPVLNARMENRTCIEWNKDDIEALEFFKVDVLALGMLTCIRKGFDLLAGSYGIKHNLASVPQDDPKVYEMISKADTIGVFQIESRAQQSMLPRLRPNRFYDLVIEVAIVRPGPIQGDMVHPYLRRRNGEEKVEYPSAELESILKRTLGVPLFQEQAMQIAITAAGFSPTEADQLRRSMATFKAKGKVSFFEEKLITGMVSKGYELEYAKRVFRQLEGFGSYGFPESHAVSFALLVYISSWLKCHFPDIFACALLNSQPMGFYQPSQIIIDAQKHGVEIRPVDVNYSDWDNKLEERSGNYCVLRLGFRQVKGLREEEMKMVTDERSTYTSIHELREKGVAESVIERLAEADAFRSLGSDRRDALWEATVKDKPLAIFPKRVHDAPEEKVVLPAMSLSEHVVHDYAAMSLSLKAHPVSFVRDQLDQLRISPTSHLENCKDGDLVKVAGLILVRQRPGTASGICFITIEDETGTANLVVFQKLFDQYRKEIIQSRLIMVEGRVQREKEVIHVVVKRCFNLSALLQKLLPYKNTEPLVSTLAKSDEITAPVDYNGNRSQVKEVVQGKIFPEGRNFR